MFDEFCKDSWENLFTNWIFLPCTKHEGQNDEINDKYNGMVFLISHCRVEQNLTSKKFPRETEGAILTSATRWFENWSYFHFWLASKREAQYLSLEMSYSKNFKNGNFLHPMTQLLIIHNFFQNSAHQVKKLGFRRPQKNLFFGFFSTFSIANIKSCQ